MASRHERESRHGRAREDEHTLRSRETWQGGGELGFRQLDPSAERSGPGSAPHYEPDDDHDYAGRYGYYEDRRLARDDRGDRGDRDDHGHRRNWVDRILGRDHDQRTEGGRSMRTDRDRDNDRDFDERRGWLQRGQDVGRIYHREEDERIPRGFDRRPRITGEAETDWEVRGYRNAGHDGRIHQFAGYREEDGDNMRGQFRRSRDDGEMRDPRNMRDMRGAFDRPRDERMRDMRDMRGGHEEQRRDVRGLYDRPRDERGRFVDEGEQRREMRGHGMRGHDMRGERDMRGGRDMRDDRDLRGGRDMRDDRDLRGGRDMRDDRDLRGGRDMRDDRESRYRMSEDRSRHGGRSFFYSPRDVDDQRDVHDWRDVHDQRDIRDTHEIRDERDPRYERSFNTLDDSRRFGGRRNR